MAGVAQPLLTVERAASQLLVTAEATAVLEPLLYDQAVLPGHRQLLLLQLHLLLRSSA